MRKYTTLSKDPYVNVYPEQSLGNPCNRSLPSCRQIQSLITDNVLNLSFASQPFPAHASAAAIAQEEFHNLFQGLGVGVWFLAQGFGLERLKARRVCSV